MFVCEVNVTVLPVRRSIVVVSTLIVCSPLQLSKVSDRQGDDTRRVATHDNLTTNNST